MLVRTLAKPRNLLIASTTALAVSCIAPSVASTLGNFNSRTMSSNSQSYPLQKSEEEWRVQLSKEQFRILRGKGTEMAGTGEYDKHYPGKGVYECAGCGQPLYTADTKFDSGCGWPAFFDCIPGAITTHVDSSYGMKRVEIVCSQCGGHQGHIFLGERHNTPTSDRHCVNSVSIRYNPDVEKKWEKYSNLKQ